MKHTGFSSKIDNLNSSSSKEDHQIMELCNKLNERLAYEITEFSVEMTNIYNAKPSRCLSVHVTVLSSLLASAVLAISQEPNGQRKILDDIQQLLKLNIENRMSEFGDNGGNCPHCEENEGI